MKKIIFSLLILVTSFSAFIQRGSWDGMMRKGLNVGVVGSFNSSWILNQNNFGTLEKFQDPLVRQSELAYIFTWGGNVGADLTYNFHKRWGISFQPSYSWAGQNYNDDMWGAVGVPKTSDTLQGWYVPAKGAKRTNVKRDIKLNYFQIPILVRFQTKIGDNANFYVQLGPQIGVRTFAKESVQIKGYDYVSATSFPPNKRFNLIDAGLALNFGVDIYATDWLYFNLGLANYVGLTDLNGKVIKDLDWYSKNDVGYQKSYNMRVGLQAGVHFFLKKQRFY